MECSAGFNKIYSASFDWRQYSGRLFRLRPSLMATLPFHFAIYRCGSGTPCAEFDFPPCRLPPVSLKHFTPARYYRCDDGSRPPRALEIGRVKSAMEMATSARNIDRHCFLARLADDMPLHRRVAFPAEISPLRMTARFAGQTLTFRASCQAALPQYSQSAKCTATPLFSI